MSAVRPPGSPAPPRTAIELPDGRRVPVDDDVARALAGAAERARHRGASAVSGDDLAAALAAVVGSPRPTDGARRPPARITPYRDGPYLLRGAFELTDQDGTPIPCARRTVALCRCGRSQLRPFCDGTHKLVGFRADGGAEGPATPPVTPPPPDGAS